ncbi:DUF2612 domain-containing protein [Enterobacter roggenkampii]|uniref:DUF2612 domain-containing protein n=1 Tax=Enterobacter roggenkampii TaxID=1812935 RepID=UPI002A82F70D|nr:DUF2612 domain-containing protein [Enterobacter roggenkampii]
MAFNQRHGLDLLLAQYRNSPNLIKYISIFLTEFDVLVKVFEDIKLKRRLPLAKGMQLDDIVEIVGTGRVVYGADPLGYFGYFDNPQAYAIDVGILKSEDSKHSGDLILSDKQLRSRIKARIIKTMGNVCIEDLLQYCDLTLGRELDIELTEGTASVNLKYHGILSPADKALLSTSLTGIKVVGVPITLQDDAGNIVLQYPSKDYPVRT